MSSKETSEMCEQNNEHYGLVPRLRFPEFHNSGEWSAKPLKELAKRCTGKNSRGKHTRVLTNSAEYGVVDQRDYFEKDIANQNNLEGYYIVEEGDYVYNPRISKSAPVGPISKNKIGTGVMSPLYTVFRFTGRDNDFFAHYFKSTHWHHYMRQASSTGARHDRMSITTDDFMSMPLPVSAPKEQQRITDCLSSLDELITAENQKLDILKTRKKGLMRQLFPREGETIPLLRFPEFQDAGEWEEKPLGQLGDVLMCKRIFANETNDVDGVPFFKIGTLGGAPDAFISKELFEAYKTKYNFPRVGELLITCSGTVGKCIQYDGQDAYYQDSNIVWIDNPALDISNEFLNVFIQSVDWRALNSTTITRIYGADLRGLMIKFPAAKKEQELITNCLSSLDDLITVQTNKIDALKTHKKGLAQQLFPVLEEVQT